MKYKISLPALFFQSGVILIIISWIFNIDSLKKIGLCGILLGLFFGTLNVLRDKLKVK